MLTFTTAPKTLLGPCTHALWNGKSLYARHHIHMPSGEAKWRDDVAKVMAHPDAQKAADAYIAAEMALSGMAKFDKRDHQAWSDAMVASESAFASLRSVCRTVGVFPFDKAIAAASPEIVSKEQSR